jgi:hypothetical protein
MLDWAAARLAGVERAADSGCGAHRGAMGRKIERRGPHHGQEMVESGDGARSAVSSKGGGSSVLIDEVIRMRRGEAKVWNGGGGSWSSRRCLL